MHTERGLLDARATQTGYCPEPRLTRKGNVVQTTNCAIFLVQALFLVVAQRNQIIVLKRSVKKPRIKERDRIFWMFLSRIWADWKEHLVIVKPKTVTDWHRNLGKRYWRMISKPVSMAYTALFLE